MEITLGEQLEEHKNCLMENLEPEKWEMLSEIIETVEFKYNKSNYHLNNIKEKILKSNNFEQDNYYEEIYSGIYYEMESFLIAIRSSVDVLLHFINEGLELGIESRDIILSNVYRNPKTTQRVRNVLHKHTHNRNSIIWNFIYQARNEIVHEKSVVQITPVTVNFFDENNIQAFIDVNGQPRNLMMFYQSCLHFLSRFIVELTEAISYFHKN